MAIALVAHTIVSGVNTSTSPAIDTTGATLLVISLSWINSQAIVISDSKGNTWTAITAFPNNGGSVELFYVANPTVGAGHTFTFTGTGVNAALTVQAFSGIVTVSPLDSSTGSTQGQASNITTITPGPITPTQNSELVVTGFHENSSGSTGATIDSGFAITDGIVHSVNNLGGAMAWKVPPAPSAQNPVWSSNAAPGRLGAAIATFKNAAPPSFGAMVTQSVIESLAIGVNDTRVTQSVIEFLVGLGVVCNNPPNGKVGIAYTHTLLSGGGTPPVTFAISAGTIPPGLSLAGGTGILSGIPLSSGTFNFTVTVTDSFTATASVNCSITIIAQQIYIQLAGWKLYPDQPCGEPEEIEVAPPIERAL